MNSKNNSIRSKKNSCSANPAIFIPAPIDRWNQPLIFSSTYYEIASRIGYLATLAAVIAFAIFIFICYLNKVVLLEPDLLQKIHSDTQKEKPSIQIYGNLENMNWFRKNEEIGFHAQLNQNSSVLIKIPISMIKLPHKGRRIAIMPHFTYKGTPKLNFGFGKEGSISIQELLSNFPHPGIEFMPKDEFFNGIPNPVFYEEKQFSSSWKQADFFFFSIYALTPSDIYLIKLALIEG